MCFITAGQGLNYYSVETFTTELKKTYGRVTFRWRDLDWMKGSFRVYHAKEACNITGRRAHPHGGQQCVSAEKAPLSRARRCRLGHLGHAQRQPLSAARAPELGQ